MLVGTSGAMAATPTAPTPPTPRVAVSLGTNSAGGLTVTVDRQISVTWQRLHDQGPQILSGIELAAGPTAATLVLRGLKSEAIIEADRLGDWAAKVPRGDQATWHIDLARRLIDLTTPVENPEPVTLRFGDGGRAEVNAGSVSRFDRLEDGAYIFSGRGNVYAIDNAGLATALTSDRPPLTGGPLLENARLGGTAKQSRPSALTTVTVTGELGATLTVQAGDQVAHLNPGSRQTLELQNGAVLELRQNPVTQTLDWRADKGYFRFQIAGMNCWHPLGLAGQTAALQWNAVARMGDVRNLSPDRELLVDLAIRYFAEVGPKTILQYTQFEDCTTFSVSATGGQARLFNAESGREYSVDLNNFLVKNGVPETDASGVAQLASKPRKTIVLSGESGSQFQVQGSLGTTVVAPNSQKTLQGSGSSQVQINYDSGGRLSVEAVAGDYMILLPTTAGNLAVGLNQGDTISLSGNPNGGQITFQTASGNLSPVVLSAGGQGWNVGPNSQATIKTGIGENGFLVANTSGSVNPIVSPLANEI
ncbi:MAG: hypothetical protein KGS61_13330, partial [Verrucomicrobia bacterium]|nr:hypothetical protein [Verrucomicrobiota bacterium]